MLPIYLYLVMQPDEHKLLPTRISIILSSSLIMLGVNCDTPSRRPSGYRTSKKSLTLTFKGCFPSSEVENFCVFR
ncbi:MAG: hypothetical protein WBA41_16690 [Rivularia sp. (in: cyanobacteria)]